MRRRPLTLLAAFIALGLMPGPALAGGGGDQFNEPHELCLFGTDFAQTVTVGQTGKLTGVDLYLFESSGNQTTASIKSLYRGTTFPTGSALASATVEVTYEGWYHFQFPTPVDFISGGKFAIVFSVTGQGCAFGSDTNPYAGGNALAYKTAWTNLNGNADLDFAFRTWVVPAGAATATPQPTADPAPSTAPTAAPTATPVPTKTPPPAATKTPLAAATKTQAAATKAAAGATGTAIAAASVTSGDPSGSALTGPTGSATASTSTAAPIGPADPPDGSSGSGGSGGSGGLPVPIVVGGIALLGLAAASVGIGFVLGRRRP